MLLLRVILATMFGIGWFVIVLKLFPGRWGLAAGVSIPLTAAFAAGFFSFTRKDRLRSATFDARQLRFWLATLSPGDLSINEAAAARPGSAMITGIGSSNDALWSQMERVGWAQQIAVDDPSMAGVGRIYAFTEAGARAVTTALAELKS